MKAVVAHAHDAFGTLQLEDVEVPKPGLRDVLIEVRAASINYVDIWVRRGISEVRLKLPLIPGSDAAGVVREIGEGVTGVSTGTSVAIKPGISCGRCEFCTAGSGSQCIHFAVVGEHRNGSYAQFLAVPEHIVLPIPDSLPFEEVRP